MLRMLPGAPAEMTSGVSGDVLRCRRLPDVPIYDETTSGVPGRLPTCRWLPGISWWIRDLVDRRVSGGVLEPRMPPEAPAEMTRGVSGDVLHCRRYPDTPIRDKTPSGVFRGVLVYRAPPHVPAHDHMVGWGLGEVCRGSHGVLTMGQWDIGSTNYRTNLRETFHFFI